MQNYCLEKSGVLFTKEKLCSVKIISYGYGYKLNTENCFSVNTKRQNVEKEKTGKQAVKAKRKTATK